MVAKWPIRHSGLRTEAAIWASSVRMTSRSTWDPASTACRMASEFLFPAVTTSPSGLR